MTPPEPETAQLALPAPPPAAPTLLNNLRQEIGHLPFARNGRGGPAPEPTESDVSVNRALRRRVHEVLNHYAMSGDQRDDMELLQAVYDELDLTEIDRVAAQNYVANWIPDRRPADRIATGPWRRSSAWPAWTGSAGVRPRCCAPTSRRRPG